MILRRCTHLLMAVLFLMVAFASAQVDTTNLVQSLNDLTTYLEARDEVTTAGGFFSSPAVVTSLLTFLGALATLILTQGVKLSTMIRGEKTQLLALLFSALTAGATTFLTLYPGVPLWQAATGAVIATLLSFLGAIGVHEQKRYGETGLRKPERQKAKREAQKGLASSMDPGAVIDDITHTVIDVGLKLAPLPPIVAETIKEYLSPQAAKLLRIAAQRPLTQAEQRDWLRLTRHLRGPAPKGKVVREGAANA